MYYYLWKGSPASKSSHKMASPPGVDVTVQFLLNHKRFNFPIHYLYLLVPAQWLGLLGAVCGLWEHRRLLPDFYCTVVLAPVTRPNPGLINLNLGPMFASKNAEKHFSFLNKPLILAAIHQNQDGLSEDGDSTVQSHNGEQVRTKRIC